MGTHPIFESDFDCLTDWSMIELGYWKIRGLVGAARVLLEYCDADWSEKLYEAHPKEDDGKGQWHSKWNLTEWTGDKESEQFQKNFHFPNLPWMKDGDVHLTQSTAILKYIARKFDIGQDLSESEARRVDLMTDQITDDRLGVFMWWYGFSPFKFEDREVFYSKRLLPQLTKFDTFMSKSTFVAGEQLTFVDFMLWEMLDSIQTFDAQVLSKFENLARFKVKFEALSKISAYIKSDRFIKGPFCNKMAIWNQID